MTLRFDARSGAWLVAALVAFAGGLLLLSDRSGLAASYFPLEAGWQGRPAVRKVGEPQVSGPEELTRVLVSRAVCSVRWRGWLQVDRPGRHAFALASGGASYLRLDGDELLATGGGREPARAEVELGRGLHRIEVGLRQAGDPSRLATAWTPPGEDEPVALPADSLYPRRPASVYRLLRRVTAGASPVARRGLGALLVLVGLLCVRAQRRPLARALERFARPGAAVGRGRRVPRAALLLAGLFVGGFLATFPFTAGTVGGDDVRYQAAAVFDQEASGYLNRYVHVYLLKIFVALAGGDAFLGSRLLWSFLFAATLAALGLATRSLGPRLQLGTLAVTLFLLASQTTLTGNPGAVFPDTTAMAFVTLGVAVYLRAAGGGAAEGPAWNALWLGALTVAAFKSKETGIILLWLVPLLAWSGGRLDGRRLARRLGYWTAGALGAYLVLMLLDAWFLGDLFYSLRWENLAAVGETNFASEVLASRRGPGGWIDVVAGPRGSAHPADYALRNLGLLTVAAAFVAAGTGASLERRLLHLMPLAYLLMMIALHVRATYIYSARYLLPIVPVACLFGGMLFHYLGVDGPWWRRLGSPQRLVPVFLAVAAIALVLTPIRLGDLSPGALLPVERLAALGWTPENLAASTLGPAVLLLVAAAGVLATRRPEARLLLLLVALVGFFHVGLELGRRGLVTRLAAQRAALILYPWSAFEEELAGTGTRRVVVSPDLFRRYGMGGQALTREPLARLYFRNPELALWQAPTPGGADFAVASRRDYDRWRRQIPGLAATARSDPSGLLVLVRPAAARDAARADSAARGP